MLTIIASIERELSGLRREVASAPFRRSLDLQVIGVGKAQSQAGLQQILNPAPDTRPTALLMLGFAGAVDPNLKTGDLVISSRYYLDGDDKNLLLPDPAMWQNAITVAATAELAVIHVDSLTVDGIISAPAAKSVLAGDYPVGIVGMEDYWLAQTARDAGIPFISVRAVLDTAEQRLPSYLLGLSRGRPLDVLRTAAMPWRVPALLGLAHQAHAAQRTLTRFADSFIRQWEKEADASTEDNVAGAVAR